MAGGEDLTPFDDAEEEDNSERRGRADNRTGRRTRRRASTGPPLSRTAAADLSTLLAQGSQVNRSQALGRGIQMPIFNAIPVPVSQLVLEPVEVPRLQKYLDWLQSNDGLNDVNLSLPISKKLVEGSNALYTNYLETVRCKCGNFLHNEMYVCFKNGHMSCGKCILYHQTDIKGRLFGFCVTCHGTGYFRKMSDAFLANCTFQCQFKAMGCQAEVKEFAFGNHAISCTTAWRCFICSEVIKPECLAKHFGDSTGRGHPAVSLLHLKPSSGPELEMELQIRIPYNCDWAVGNFHVKDLGLFYIYQAKIGEYSTTWFVVHNGTKEASEKLEVEIKLSATSISKEKQSFSYHWINRVFPWKYRYVHSVQDVMKSDFHHENTATFKYKMLAELDSHSFRTELKIRVRPVPEGKECRYGHVSSPQEDSAQ